MKIARPFERKPDALPIPPAVKTAVTGMAAVSPALAAWSLDRMWFTPPRPRISPKAKALLDRCGPLGIEVDGRKVAAWTSGKGPTVALMHGWGGYGAQLGLFVEPLVEAGYQVAVFDALGHGESDASALGVRQGSFLEFANGLRAIREALGPLHAVIAHSGGCTALGIALRRGLSLDRMVLVAPMATPRRYAVRFDRTLDLTPELGDRWKARAERRVGFRFNDLALPPLAKELALPPTLLVHDTGDRDVPFTESEDIATAWPNTELHATRELGHLRILRDAKVVARVTEFLREGARTSGVDLGQSTAA